MKREERRNDVKIENKSRSKGGREGGRKEACDRSQELKKERPRKRCFEDGK